MGKKKAGRKQARREISPPEQPEGEAPARPTELELAPAVTDPATLRAAVGKGTLAEKALDTIQFALTELERVYTEVAALGESLALAREQLVDQEAEIEALQEAAEAARNAAARATRSDRPRPARPSPAAPPRRHPAP